MADLTFQNLTSYQPNNTSFQTQIPTEGALFRSPAGVGGVNKVIGDTVYTLPDKYYQGDVSALPEYHPDIPGNVLKGGRQTITDFAQFQGLQPKGTPTSSGTSGNQPLPPGVSSYNAPTAPNQMVEEVEAIHRQPIREIFKPMLNAQIHTKMRMFLIPPFPQLRRHPLLQTQKNPI
jgi:hypothetical protein